MQSYRHKQTGTALLIIMLFAACILIISTYDMVRVMNISLAVLAVASILFSSLTVYVDEDAISWHFGIKFWHRSIKLNQIASAKIITTKWYYGLGIRLTPAGWLYTVSGNQAIELTKLNGERVAIGTNDASGLIAQLKKRHIDSNA